MLETRPREASGSVFIVVLGTERGRTRKPFSRAPFGRVGTAGDGGVEERGPGGGSWCAPPARSRE